jgi:ABC-2 type transport system permease protein
MDVILAFIKRDARLAFSYRLSFLLQFLGMFLAAATFYFLSRIIGNTMNGPLESYGGDYFSFALLGLAFSTYMALGLSTFSETIREGQMMGTLEIMLLSPTRLSLILVASSLWGYIFGSFRVVILLLFGSIVFGVSFANANIPAIFVILLLSIISFASIGMISAAFVMILKKGDPITWVMSGLSTLLSGAIYPVQVLPGWLQTLSGAFPLTYTLNAGRHAMIQGSSIYELRSDILVLFGFCVILLPLAFFSFRNAVRRAKIEGSLVHY